MIYDATFPVSKSMQTYPAPWHSAVNVEQTATLERCGRRASQITIGSHSGTHIDAPAHFLRGPTIDQMPIDLMVGSAILVDLRPHLQSKVIGAAQIQEALGNFSIQRRTILNCGYSQTYGSPDFYTNSPYLAHDAADFLMSEGVQLLGYDLPSPDNPEYNYLHHKDSPIHKLFLSANVWLLEYLNVPAKICGTLPIEIFVAPLPIVDGDGSPVRCLLEVRDQ